MNCKYNILLPSIGACCTAYYKSRREDGKEWLHFPVCTEVNCPLNYSELLEGAMLESEEVRMEEQSNGKSDIVEVVRCKDCKHWWLGDRCSYLASYPDEPYMNADDFCSYGEKK